MSKIRTAVVGTGSLGRHHVRWLSQLPQSELVGVYDTDPAKADQYAAEYRVQSFASLDELAGQVEACSIVVTTSAHYEVASKLIAAGVHCLIEKPITTSCEQAVSLQRLAADKGVKVAVGHIERFNPAIRALANLDVRPSFIEAHRLAAFDPRGADVAVVLDLMIHDIDLCLVLTGSKVVDIQSSAVAVISVPTLPVILMLQTA
jgi:predicted dehydrogenase